MKWAVRSLNFNVIAYLSHLENYSTQLNFWLAVAEYGEETSIPKAKSGNQSFHTSAECAFLSAGLDKYLALQVNVTENNTILAMQAKMGLDI